MPNRPFAPPPQHLTVLLLSTAHVWVAPALTATAVRPDPSGTAVRAAPISPAPSPMSIRDPIPSWPSPPTPQHTTSLRSRITQVCAAPTLIALAVRPAPRSTFGNDAPISPASSPREFSFPLPKRPLPPAPQHCTAPLDNSTQLWASPAAIATTRTPALSPSDTAGRASPISPAPSPRALVSPKPSWPSSLRPQHFTASLSSTTQVCAAPVASNLAVRPVPRSTAGRPSPIDAVVRPISVVAP